MSEKVDLLLDHIAELVEQIDGIGDAVLPLGDEEAAQIRAALDHLGSAVRGAVTVTENRLLALLDVGQTLKIPGGGSIAIVANPKVSNHGARLARLLACMVADRPADEDGVPIPPAVLCQRTAEEIVQVFGLENATQSFRTTEVTKRGHNPSQFRDYEDGLPKVRFMR